MPPRPYPVALVVFMIVLSCSGTATGDPAASPCPPGESCDTIVTVDAGARFRLPESLAPGAGAAAWFFGDPGDVALMGDWDCDGTATPAMYRSSTGFVYLRNDLQPGPATQQFFFGDPADVPLAGDFDGDGCDTLSVYRPDEATMYVSNRLGQGRADLAYVFGDPGDRPFVADFDGDGIDTLGLHRPSTGWVYFRNSHRTGRADFGYFYGDPGDVILAGDWNGDGVDTLAVHRPAHGEVYFRMSNTQGRADHVLAVGDGVTVVPVRSAAAGPAASALDGFGPGWEAAIGARIDGSAPEAVLHVDAGHPAASDANPATAAAPLLTLGAAIDRAQDERSAGSGVRIVVQPGVYRESVQIVGPNRPGPDPPLVLEAAVPGTVVVSGADVWDGWTEAGGGQWTASWPHDWGPEPVPPGWEDVDVPDVVRRREAVFVDGAPLAQVAAPTDLAPGTFLVDEVGDVLRVIPADPAGFPTAVVEAALRPETLRILLTDHVTVDGLTFRHATGGFGNSVAVLESDDVLLRDVAIEWNAWGGLQLFDAERVTVTRSSASHNGGRGIGMADAASVLLDEVAARANNWRGGPAGFTGWSVAGIKVHHLHDALFRDVDTSGNDTRGLWLDTDNVRVLVDRATSCDNRRDGVFVEASQGPVVLRDARLCRNRGHGLLSANAVGVRVVDSSVCGNQGAQLELSGLPERTIDLHRGGGTLTLPPAADWLLSGNRIADSGGSATLVGTTLGGDDMATFGGTLDAAGNDWRSRQSAAFEVQDGRFRGFDGWRDLTGDSSGFGGGGECGS